MINQWGNVEVFFYESFNGTVGMIECEKCQFNTKREIYHLISKDTFDNINKLKLDLRTDIIRNFLDNKDYKYV